MEVKVDVDRSGHMPEEWISLREFARRRGVALSAVQKAIETGRVTAVRRDSAGRLEAIEHQRASEEWNANTDPVQAARTGKVLETPSAPAPTLAVQATRELAEPESQNADASDPIAVSDKDPHGYYKARAEREQHQAKLAELELLQELGRLVDVRRCARWPSGATARCATRF